MIKTTSIFTLLTCIGLTACTTTSHQPAENIDVPATTKSLHHVYYICKIQDFLNPDLNYLSVNGSCTTRNVFSIAKSYGPLLPGTKYSITKITHEGNYKYNLHIESGHFAGWDLITASPILITDF
jgi:hypothetical protein